MPKRVESELQASEAKLDTMMKSARKAYKIMESEVRRLRAAFAKQHHYPIKRLERRIARLAKPR